MLPTRHPRLWAREHQGLGFRMRACAYGDCLFGLSARFLMGDGGAILSFKMVARIVCMQSLARIRVIFL